MSSSNRKGIYDGVLATFAVFLIVVSVTALVLSWMTYRLALDDLESQHEFLDKFEAERERNRLQGPGSSDSPSA